MELRDLSFVKNSQLNVTLLSLAIHVSCFLNHRDTNPKLVDSPITDSFETFILIETEITSVDDSGGVCLYCQLIQRREITFMRYENPIERR